MDDLPCILCTHPVWKHGLSGFFPPGYCACCLRLKIVPVRRPEAGEHVLQEPLGLKDYLDRIGALTKRVMLPCHMCGRKLRYFNEPQPSNLGFCCTPCAEGKAKHSPECNRRKYVEQFEAQIPPDQNCITLPNGDCIGVDCMHDLREGATP